MSATYSQFVLEAQLNRHAVNVGLTNNAVNRRGRSLPAAAVASTSNVSVRLNRVHVNSVKRGKCFSFDAQILCKSKNSIVLIQFHSIHLTEAQSNVRDNVDSSPEIHPNTFDAYDNDDLNDNGVDSTVGIADDNEADDVETTQPIFESKPNLTYGFRDRNSPIFARRRRAISALLQVERVAARNQRPRKTPKKKQPLEKKFKCDQCSYASANKSRMKEHKLGMHSAEKPFQCDICKMRMGYRHSLKKHSQRRHNIILLS